MDSDSPEGQPLTRRSSISDAVLWLLTIVSILVVAGFVCHVVVQFNSPSYGQPTPLGVQRVPTVAEVSLKVRTAELEAEQFGQSPRPRSVAEAIAILSADYLETIPSAQRYGATRVAVAYLRDTQIPPKQHAMVAQRLLGLQVPLTDASLTVLSRTGAPADGQKLAARNVGREYLVAWLDLLEQWETPLQKSSVERLLFAEDRSQLFAHELTRRGWIKSRAGSSDRRAYKRAPGASRSMRRSQARWPTCPSSRCRTGSRRSPQIGAVLARRPCCVNLHQKWLRIRPRPNA